jgi:type I site-specific restriction endonuclease
LARHSRLLLTRRSAWSDGNAQTQNNVDTYSYFGEPIYTYSLKDGINDGFLTPFRVKRIKTTLDEYIYSPDDKIIQGEVENNKQYKEEDINKVIEIVEREAYRVKIFLEQADQKQKTIVFCKTQLHAGIVRDLINQMKDSDDPDYCCRVTAEDGGIGDQHLWDFWTVRDKKNNIWELADVQLRVSNIKCGFINRENEEFSRRQQQMLSEQHSK